MRTARFSVEIEYHPTGEYFAIDFDMEFDDPYADEDEWNQTELEQAAYDAVMENVMITPTFIGWDA